MTLQGAGRRSVLFAETAGNQLVEGLDRGRGLVAGGLDRDGRAGRGAEHHQPHDRGAADGLAAAGHADGGVEALDRLAEFRRGAGVQALLVDDLQHPDDGVRRIAAFRQVAVEILGAAHFPASTRLAMVTYLRPGRLGRGDRLLERAFVADLRELHQHRHVDAGEHFDVGPAHAGDRQVRRRAAEHVGQDGDAVAGVDALDRLDDVLAALLDVIVRADGDGLDLALRADDVLQRSAKLDGEPPVGDENKADHRREIPAGAVAPHERAAIIIIQSPSSRARRPICSGLLHCSKRPGRGFRRHAVCPRIWGFRGQLHASRIAEMSRGSVGCR